MQLPILNKFEAIVILEFSHLSIVHDYFTLAINIVLFRQFEITNDSRH